MLPFHEFIKDDVKMESVISISYRTGLTPFHGSSGAGSAEHDHLRGGGGSGWLPFSKRVASEAYNAETLETVWRTQLHPEPYQSGIGRCPTG